MASAPLDNLLSSADTEEDKISHSEVETWSVDSLKEYCRRRGYKTTGLKKELVSLVYVLYNKAIPEVPDAREQELSRKKDYKYLVAKTFPATDPQILKTWIGEKEGLKMWPPVSYLDIHWFLKDNGSVGLTKEALTAYKTGKAFSYFQCDWLQEVFYCPINKNHRCCFLKAKCMPSNRISDNPHNLWVKVIKDCGEIVSAYCSCVAGLSQTCNHVAALLFKLNHAHKLELSNPACTSTTNAWKTPAGTKTELNLRLQGMIFSKPDYSKGKVPTQVPVELKTLCKVREYLVQDTDPDCYKNLISGLREVMPDASIFLPGRRVRQEVDEASVGDAVLASGSTPTPPADDDICIVPTAVSASVAEPSSLPLPAGADISTLARSCLDTKELISKMTLNNEDIAALEQQTIGQSDNPLWFQLRKGRVTASKFYNVHTRIESMKRDSTKDCDNLVRNLLFPPALHHISHISRGAKLEEAAFRRLEQVIYSLGHTNVKAKHCGLFIDTNDQFLGASPDGIVTCDCCEPRLIEIKCPTTPLDAYPHIDKKTGKLKHNDVYYGQVQGQMMVAQYKETWFFVYYEDQHHIEIVHYDEPFSKKMRSNLCVFYRLYMAPEILLGRKRKIQ